MRAAGKAHTFPPPAEADRVSTQGLARRAIAEAERCSEWGKIEASRGVAQPGSASALGAEGRQFESDRPDQHTHYFLCLLIGEERPAS